MYIVMKRIRLFEEKIADLIDAQPPIRCPVHLYTGQEAVAAGVCANLRQNDYVFSTHRSHGHYIAKGGSVKAMMAELYGKATGCSRGRGGSMHLAYPTVGLPGSSAIVGGTIPIAVGAALAFKMQGNGAVSVVFFGDGAANEGVFYESLNFAALKKLPVIFVCENNLYSTHMPVSACLSDTEIYKKAAAFCLPGIRINGNDVKEIYGIAGEAINNARQGQGPALIECLTYRWHGHVGGNYDLDKGLRSKDELDHWLKKCPINIISQYLYEHNIISELEENQIQASINQEIEEAISLAMEDPYPDKSELGDGLLK